MLRIYFDADEKKVCTIKDVNSEEFHNLDSIIQECKRQMELPDSVDLGIYGLKTRQQ